MHNLIKSYFAIGQDLQLRLSNPQIPDPALPENISKWIFKTTEELLQIIPKECSDYIDLDNINDKYKDNPNILLPSAKMDICRVLQNLKIANDHLLAFENADYKNIPPENLANINYEQLKRASDFAKQQLIKELKGKENGVTSKTTILNIYGKICLWVQSIIKMDGPECCLALASSVRAILELFIDLNLIDRDIIKYGVDKYFSFPRVEKYRRAKSIVEKRKKLLLNIKTEDQFLSKSENSESNINTLRKKWWGKSKKGNPVIPDHWTNKTLWQRIEELNDQNIVGIYFSSYYYANWCVHSMYFDMINDINNVHLFNWHLYELAYKMFRSSTELLNNIFQVLKKDDLDDSFNKVEEETFKSFLGQMLIAGRNKDD